MVIYASIFGYLFSSPPYSLPLVSFPPLAALLLTAVYRLQGLFVKTGLKMPLKQLAAGYIKANFKVDSLFLLFPFHICLQFPVCSS